MTKEVVTDIISRYLNHQITREELVDWAEQAICNGDFSEQDSSLLTEIVGHLGLADVKEFGLSWDDCYNYLSRLGHHVEVLVS